MSNFHYRTLHIKNEDLTENGKPVSIPEFMDRRVIPALSNVGYKAVQVSKYEWNLTKDDAKIHFDWNPKDGSYELTVESATNGNHIIREILKHTPFINEKQWHLTYHPFWLNPDDRTFTCVGSLSSLITTLGQLGYCYRMGYLMRLKDQKLRIFALSSQNLWPSIIVCHELSKSKDKTIKIRLVMPQESAKAVILALENANELQLVAN